jgi:phage gp36-like protein
MFLETNDFKETIKAEILDDVLDGEPDALEEADAHAVELVGSYLNGLYDTVAIFDATGVDRHKTIVALVMDIALYRLHFRINPRQIPDIRRIAYEDALALLKAIQKRESNPVGLPPAIDDEGNEQSISRFGGNTKMNHRW